MAGNSNSGARKDAVKFRYQQILESSGAYVRFQKILKQTVKDENFLKAFEMAEDRASGKPLQKHEVEDVTDGLSREELEELRAALRPHQPTIGVDEAK
jgi:hypothetical protein